MRSADAILFDLDGTLVDSLDDIAACLNLALKTHGLPQHPRDRVRTFVGDGVRALIERAVPSRAEHAVDAVLSTYRDAYAAAPLDRTRPYEGVEDVLKELGDSNVPLAVLSNKPHDATVSLVARLFPDVPFAFVLGHRVGRAHKPDPSSALEAIASFGSDPGTWALIGDGEADMRTARRAGMWAIAALWGYRDRETLAAAGAETFLMHPAEIRALRIRARLHEGPTGLPSGP